MVAPRRRNQRTAAQAAKDRRELERAIRRDLKSKDRAKVVALRARIREVKAERTRAIHEALRVCKTRPETVASARRRLAEERKQARATCRRAKDAARSMKDDVARARVELAAERTFQAEMRRIERGNREKDKRQKRPGLARATRQESDEEVEGNIPPELVALWRRVRRSIRGSERQSRTEAFLRYAEEHPDETWESLESRTDEVIAELERRERMGNPRKGKRRKKNTERKIVSTRGGGRAGKALAKERATVHRLRAKIRSLEKPKRRRAKNPRRPPHAWWAKCLSSVEAQRYARDPAAVCGAAWWKIPAARRASIVRRMERSRTRRTRRAAYAIAKAERNRASRAYRRRNPAMSDGAARREYERTHWGERGTGRVRQGRAADPRHGTLTELGELVEVVYKTKKGGDRQRFEYEHGFEGRKPTLAYNDGGLVIVDGDYTVKVGGITG